MLAWPKFPEGVNFDWQIIEGNGIPKSADPKEAV
jgi:hypothetical protein